MCLYLWHCCYREASAMVQSIALMTNVERRRTAGSPVITNTLRSIIPTQSVTPLMCARLWQRASADHLDCVAGL